MGQALTLEEIRKIVQDKEILKSIEDGKDVVLRVNNEAEIENDPLVEIEIAIRKLERLGTPKD